MRSRNLIFPQPYKRRALSQSIHTFTLSILYRNWTTAKSPEHQHTPRKHRDITTSSKLSIAKGSCTLISPPVPTRMTCHPDTIPGTCMPDNRTVYDAASPAISKFLYHSILGMHTSWRKSYLFNYCTRVGRPQNPAIAGPNAARASFISSSHRDLQTETEERNARALHMVVQYDKSVSLPRACMNLEKLS